MSHSINDYIKDRIVMEAESFYKQKEFDHLSDEERDKKIGERAEQKWEEHHTI